MNNFTLYKTWAFNLLCLISTSIMCMEEPNRAEVITFKGSTYNPQTGDVHLILPEFGHYDIATGEPNAHAYTNIGTPSADENPQAYFKKHVIELRENLRLTTMCLCTYICTGFIGATIGTYLTWYAYWHS